MKLFFFLILFIELFIFISAEKSKYLYSNYEEDGHSNYAIHRKINHKSENIEDDLLYFFTLHDYNKDSELDGNELFASFMDGFDPEVEEKKDLRYILEWVDHILEEDDIDGNGKISWSEYLASQKYHSSD
ncbi:hypothetical protein BCR32DRAFT_232300 [Anaeromyces robustus]|uniref:EF-hand domain-containing protein n=1 Tax=Anaeromyces robustus TaxID=1754192 RepID=A0A1Y1X8D3_9FUNG|nr:hypothetical protein BCR32DRAFT_232300 [Anaeromyces robustus]|eukprot:ORX81968.1 hypothetical protein BCR32DRAFT_232300 [Anaeromyces robustus]